MYVYNYLTKCFFPWSSDDFSRAVGEEFLCFFDFSSQTLDNALRWEPYTAVVDPVSDVHQDHHVNILNVQTVSVPPSLVFILQVFPEGGGSCRGEPRERESSATFLHSLPSMQPWGLFLPRSVNIRPILILLLLILINQDITSHSFDWRQAHASSLNPNHVFICRVSANPHLRYDAPQHWFAWTGGL